MSTSFGAAPSLGRVAIRLRWALLKGALKPGPGSTARRTGLVVGAIAGGLLALGAFAVLSSSRGHGRLPVDLATIIYTALVIGWVVLPILTFGSDDLLDPTRLTLLPLSRRQLMTILGIGGIIGVAPIATTSAALGLLVATAHSVGSLLVGIVAAVLEVAMCVTASRATAAGLSSVLRSRRGRDLGAFLAALVAVSFQLINPAVQLLIRHSAGRGDNVLQGTAAPLRWTPPGLLATAPDRPLGLGILSLLAGAAFVGVVVWAWEVGVRHSLERPDRSGGSRRRGTELRPRVFRRLLPAGRVGAIAAKDLRYLTREPRRMVALITAILIPIVLVALAPITLGTRPGPGIVFAVCGVALLSGLSAGNRFGMDGTATWMLLSTATDRRDARRDLLGGDLAVLIVGLTLIVVVGVLAAVLCGSARDLPAAEGMSFGLLGTMVGASGFIAVSAPFAVPESRNAFSTGSTGQGCAAGVMTLLAMWVCVGLCLPLLVLLIASLFVPVYGFVLLLAGLPYGLGIGAVIRRLAVRRWDSRAPEILQTIAEARP